MHNNKVVLLTGGTDGIGKATALSLAKLGYSIHVIGRDKTKGQCVLEELQRINPQGSHQLFLLDLAEISACLAFVEDYKSTYTSLDLLILNANIAPKKPIVNSEGLDSVFMIGYISRYILASQLENLLLQAKNPRIIHINSKTDDYRKAFDFSKLQNPTYGILKSIQQCYVASTHMVLNNYSLGYSKVPSMVFDPGGVLTNQILDRGYFFTLFSKLLNAKEPEVIGDIACSEILHFVDSTDTTRICYRNTLKKAKTPSPQEVTNYKALVTYSHTLTGVHYN